MISYSEIAEEAYKAYGSVTDFKNFRGDPMPEWKALPEKIKEAWVASAAKVMEIAYKTKAWNVKI